MAVRIITLRAFSLRVVGGHSTLRRWPPLQRFLSNSTSEEEKAVQEQRPARLAIKAAILTFIAVKGWETFGNSGTFMLESTLTLLRSRHPQTQHDAVSRLDRWHTSDTALHHIVESGHISTLVNVLASPSAAARNLTLEVLCRLASLDSALVPLRDAQALTTARASCETIGDPLEAERCRALGDKLALLLGDASALEVSSSQSSG